MVEPLNQSQEGSEFFSIFHLSIECLHLLNHVVEHADDVSKYGISEQDNESAKEPFKIVDRMIVTEANSRQRGECEVSHHDWNVFFLLQIDVEMVNEIILHVPFVKGFQHGVRAVA